VLDFSRKEVVDKIYRMMAHTLKNSTVEYIKWDMNRFISEPFGKDLGLEHKGEFFHRYILGLYSLLKKINKNFPHIMIESCASGGNRFDPGLLYYAPQAWTSDNTDAISRLFIQYGTSYGYPISSIGSHVSEVPNHQVGRLTPLKTRTNVALFGTFGYELDIGKLSNEEKLQLKEDIKLFKENQEVIQKGRFYRLISPFETNNETAWICVSNNKEEALVGFYRIRNAASNPLKKIILTGLNPEYNYSVNGKEYSGIMLMKFGIILTDFYGESKVTGDYYSKIFVVKKI
jgi:alpha-galactosidase